ncbi:ABC transporter permease subunit [Haloferax gibbonsii]|uniref:Peptide ABC transporter permease n=3 Tax=Halobacteriales TaxID=2235 RepID=M0HQN2_HALGM|nr:ABC transporter permease subunit [Haloferax gibbonsii]AKU09156.1 peptide ABC transporter permease [Haloferax gibbonsii]ELZ85414.1 peptide ABC transporter permease [Haloferax gibbonsii ATCC 33959]QOS13734.1 ABC-type transport system permease protein (probable substrate dipeptide/oligopeptide) [Haloferax gibbonsii]
MVEKNYYVRRIAQALITVWAAITFSFVTVRLIPGGPMDYIAAQIRQRSGGAVSSTRLNQMVEMYSNVNPDKPMLQAYVEYIVSVAQLDFGRSIFYADPVWSVLGPAIPWTMFVSLFALVIGTIMVFLIGGFLAVHEGDTWDVVGSYFVIFSDAVPYYIVGLVLLFTLGFGTEFFPNGGRYDNALTPGFNIEFMASVLRHAALPIMSFALTSWGGLEFRAHCTRIIGEDYVDVAELRGLPDSRIQLRYIGWNSMLPMYTGLMAGLASLFGGSVIMEQIFRYRGMGFYFYEATMARDYTTVMAAVILFTIVTVVGLLIADFTYGFIDPRAGHTQRESYSRSYRETLQRFVNRLRGGGADETETIDDRIEGNRISASGAMSFDVDSSDFSRGEYIRERIDQSLLTPFRIIWTSPRARVGAIILGIFGFLGLFGPYIVPEVRPMQGPILLQPLENMRYPLGTDDIGRDLLAQQVLATRPMLIMMLSGAAVTLGLAILLGVTAGYLGGVIDKVLMTVTDVMMNIPGLALVIVLAVILEPKSPVFVGFVLAIDNWPRLARQLRSQVLTIRSESHVEASRVLGLPTSSILSKNVMSRLMPMLTMGTVGSMRNILMESVGLYFIGVLPFTTSNWGVVLNIARNGGALSGMDRFHWLLAPILFIVTMTYGLQLFAQGTDRLFNPRLRARHAATVSTDDMEGGRGGSEGGDGAAPAAD